MHSFCFFNSTWSLQGPIKAWTPKQDPPQILVDSMGHFLEVNFYPWLVGDSEFAAEMLSLTNQDFRKYTLPETNSKLTPENWWLEDDPFILEVRNVSFREGNYAGFHGIFVKRAPCCWTNVYPPKGCFWRWLSLFPWVLSQQKWIWKLIKTVHLKRKIIIWTTPPFLGFVWIFRRVPPWNLRQIPKIATKTNMAPENRPFAPKGSQTSSSSPIHFQVHFFSVSFQGG